MFEQLDEFVYLASPYTPTDATDSIENRTALASMAAASLMKQGFNVFSPIVHSHYIADHLPDSYRLDHEFWMKQDLAILSKADLLVVLCIKGWEKSKGVAREIREAKELGIPVYYLIESQINYEN